MTKLIAAAALVLSVAALPVAACPYGKTKADQSASTAPEEGTTILMPKASS